MYGKNNPKYTQKYKNTYLFCQIFKCKIFFFFYFILIFFSVKKKQSNFDIKGNFNLMQQIVDFFILFCKKNKTNSKEIINLLFDQILSLFYYELNAQKLLSIIFKSIINKQDFIKQYLNIIFEKFEESNITKIAQFNIIILLTSIVKNPIVNKIDMMFSK